MQNCRPVAIRKRDLLEAYMTGYLWQHLCIGRIGNLRFGIQHTEDTRATGEAAHKPVNHKTKGTYRHAKYQYILRDCDQRAQRHMPTDHDDAANPQYQYGDYIECQYHQGLVPG